MEKEKYIGKRLEGRYEIQQLIGTGGMANVYRAFDVIDQRDVAVKILREEYLGNEEFLRRFKNESKAIAVLNHPNIVRVYDVSFTGRVHSIVMEYINGITFKEYIERQGPLGWKEAVHFTLQILQALHHAHDKGIVHRDIKPQNIMLLADGTIKVTDFGIARFARSEVQTITDRAIGSVHYISPEQAMGEATDEKSDIYSVGVMLFEMLTGRLPFEAESAVSVALHQIQTQAVRPTSINPSIPAGLEEITIRAMQKHAAQRYPSTASMIADIETFKTDPSIHFEYAYRNTESPALQNKRIRRVINETREEKDMTNQKKTPYIPILTGVTLAFVLASVGFIMLMIYNSPFFGSAQSIAVPELIGVKYETAQEEYDTLTLKVTEEVFHDEYAKGVICEQNPSVGGAEILANSSINVKVSLGPKQITLANHTGQKTEQVMQKLHEDGLVPKQQNDYSDTVEEGCVIYTDPSKGKTLSAGEVVTVYNSLGKKKEFKEVPSEILNMDIDKAREFLELNTSFSIGNVSEVASDKPAGTIIATDPGAGNKVPEGSAIHVVVSKGGSSLTLNIELPQTSGLIDSIRARDRDNPDIIYDQDYDVDSSESGLWKPTIVSETGGEIQVNIYINQKLYQIWLVNFEESTQLLVTDRSEEPEFHF